MERAGASLGTVHRRPEGFWINARSHDPMIERLIKGLIYSVLGIPLRIGTSIEAHPLIDDAGPHALEIFRAAVHVLVAVQVL
jgi:hypothetical protein